MSVTAKICGLSTEEAVTAASDAGAAYLGFVFYPRSPRAVTPQRAARLCAGVPAGIARVGLFVDAGDRVIEAALAAAPIDILQFHGGESPERVAAAKRRFGRPVMKAVAIAGFEDLLGAARYEDVADILLFDAKPPLRPDALPGGNGLAFDWALIADRSVARSVDVVGRADRRAVAGGGAYFRGGGGRRLIRRREPPRGQGSRQNPRFSRRRLRTSVTKKPRRPASYDAAYRAITEQVIG